MRLYFLITSTLVLQCWCLHVMPSTRSPQVSRNLLQPLTNYRKPQQKPYYQKHFLLGKKEMNTWNRKQVNGIGFKGKPRQPIDKTRPSYVNQKNENAPGAYSWGYRWIDEYGTQMFREEMADGRGTVRGRYSFREANGLLRIVEYVSDEYGFRTRIRSNEPGLISSNPANAEIVRFEDENDIPERYRFV